MEADDEIKACKPSQVEEGVVFTSDMLTGSYVFLTGEKPVATFVTVTTNGVVIHRSNKKTIDDDGYRVTPTKLTAIS